MHRIVWLNFLKNKCYFAKIVVDYYNSSLELFFIKVGSMKSKRLIVLLSVLAFLTVLIVINSTLFTLQKVSVNWLTTKYMIDLNGTKDYNITDKVEIGGSIFMVQKDEISEQLEKEFPYLRVVSIETKFPNKLVIHSAERESLYAVSMGNNTYAILDEMGKVLAKSSYQKIFAGDDLGTRPILIDFESVSTNEKDYEVGQLVKSDYVKYILSSLSYSLREARYTPSTSKGVLKSVNVVSQGNSSCVNIQTRSGMVMSIDDFEDYTTSKLLLAFERYNALHIDGVVDATIEVWHNDTTKQVFAEVIW